ncbi:MULTISPECIES: hypothetical protein [Streptomyces]|uniref:Methyltransferase n=1 Tax=Streptomyces siderophoricus TaxID=2802281 RepID=A0ABS1MM89_9ACTN|nr:hypothetical protein [Streptomyces sp. 9-7]MBL1088872.1 hypothetical protein [Streptomyces sp. 9-7]
MTGYGLTECVDAAVRAYLAECPEATVVALDEGLGTGFWRLDNGLLHWLSVLPEEAAAVRRMLLPDTARRHTLAREPAGREWPAAVPGPSRGVVVIAAGVLRRLPLPAGRALLAVCAARFPGGALVFDALPRRAAALVAGRPGLVPGHIRRPVPGRHRPPVPRALRPRVYEVRFAAGPASVPEGGRPRRGGSGAGDGGRNPAARRTHCR